MARVHDGGLRVCAKAARIAELQKGFLRKGFAEPDRELDEWGQVGADFRAGQRILQDRADDRPVKQRGQGRAVLDEDFLVELDDLADFRLERHVEVVPFRIGRH